MAGVENLSPEIIALITDQLEFDGLSNFRLATRYLTSCSGPIFIKRYFHQRIHLLSRDSLMTLLEISRNPYFGPCIQELHISIDHLVPEQSLSDPISAASISRPFWLSSPQGVIPEIGYENYLIEQDWFQNLGLDTTYLTQILQNASNCHTIVLSGDERPWGAGIAKRETGYFPTSSANWEETRSFIRRAIHVTIAALTASKAKITTLAFQTNGFKTHTAKHVKSPRFLPGQRSAMDHLAKYIEAYRRF
jgi:hypothetical protein